MPRRAIRVGSAVALLAFSAVLAACPASRRAPPRYALPSPRAGRTSPSPHRFVLPAPALVLKAVFGGMADEALLASARVSPRRLLEAGYSFAFPEIQAAKTLTMVAGGMNSARNRRTTAARIMATPAATDGGASGLGRAGIRAGARGRA